VERLPLLKEDVVGEIDLVFNTSKNPFSESSATSRVSSSKFNSGFPLMLKCMTFIPSTLSGSVKLGPLPFEIDSTSIMSNFSFLFSPTDFTSISINGEPISLITLAFLLLAEPSFVGR
jgi:hypothetical protein